MTPQSSLGMGNPSQVASPSQQFNSISSQGIPAQEMEQTQNPMEQDPAEAFLGEFSMAIQPLGEFLKKPEVANLPEATLVTKALENLLAKVVGELSMPSGESAQNSLY